MTLTSARGRIIVLAATLACAHALCAAQSVLLIHNGPALSPAEQQWKRLVDYAGLTWTELSPSPRAAATLPPSASKPLLAILVSADSLTSEGERLIERLRNQGGRSVPLLIFGIESETSPQALQHWSSGALTGCVSVDAASKPTLLHVFPVEPLTNALSGLDLPAVSFPTCRLTTASQNRAVVVLDVAASHDRRPVLVRTGQQAREVFFVPRLSSPNASAIRQPGALSQAFSMAAPYLLFLQHVGGDYAWHTNAHYANFTIDDPWLTQPYGNLDYPALLAEMRKHHFHTTIAFIPWNYDRSQKEVVSLFRSNPNYFSLAIHGNNHIHREFGPYAGNPLEQQAADIQTALVRMDRFEQLTGLHYDRVMIFPHGVAPVNTFAALTRNGFLGTANSLNVPLDEQFPLDPLFLLRPYTNDYGGLLSLSRYSVEAPIPAADLAIQCFLGNPVLLYAHQQFFEGGSSAFNATADQVNALQPDTQWASLGEIATHLYESHQRGDGTTAIRMLSNQLSLTNESEHTATYFVTARSGVPDASTWLANQVSSATLSSTNNPAEVRVDLSQHASVTLTLVPAALGNSTLQTSRSRVFQAYLLRHLSDFRDMQLSTTPWGRLFVGSYYGQSGDSLELKLEQRWYVVLAAALLILGLLIAILKRSRRRNPAPRPELTTSRP